MNPGSERKKALILLNRSAGIGKAGINTWMIIKRFAEEGYEAIVYPVIPGTELVCETLIPQYEGKADIILCSGGDGTLNHVVREVMRMAKKPLLAYLPTGSTNDFARALGISAEFEKALDTIFRGVLFHYDVGSLNGRFFNYVAAFGAFSAISYATDQELKNILGHAAYIVSAVSELYENMRYSRHMRIEADDFTIEDDFIFGAVCNSTSMGGIINLKSDDVDMNDGLFEVMLIRMPRNIIDLNAIIFALTTQSYSECDQITFFSSKEIEIEAPEDMPWTLDGEYQEGSKNIVIKNVYNAIELMAPLHKSEEYVKNDVL